MPVNGVQNFNQNFIMKHTPGPRKSQLESSDPKRDLSPIDCILVYSRDGDEADDRLVKAKDPRLYSSRRTMNREERRLKFEEYLREKEGLKLVRLVCTLNKFQIKFLSVPHK